MNTNHPYFKHRNDKETSEQYAWQQIEHFTTKTDWCAFKKKTPAERSELQTRMRNFPNKNHTPVGFNVH